MEYKNNPNIEELTWKEAGKFFKDHNPQLYDIIEEWSPNKEYTILKVSYQYGDKVLNDGIINLPTKTGNLYPINNHKIPSDIKNKLSYSSFPLGMAIQGGNEVFLEWEDRVLSLAFFNPGVMLGLWESLDPVTSFFPRRVWSVAAGARSLYMLPKISETTAHDRLRKYFKLRLPAPKKMSDDSKVFAEIIKQGYKYDIFKEKWRNEILFFSNKWLEPHKNDIRWLRFYNYLLQEAWNLSSYNRNKITLDRVWQLFASFLEGEGLKPAPYLMDTVKHLVTIGCGVVPGFKPIGEKQYSGPMHLLQDVYLNIYGLKRYVPTIMEPYHFHKNDNCPAVYYSLQVPTVFESLPKSRRQTNLMTEIRELKNLMECFIQQAINGNLKIENTVYEWLIDNVEFDYFHSEQDIYSEIRLSKEMSEEDTALMYLSKSKSSEKKEFAASAAFVKGCIRISKINHSSR